MNCEGKYCEGRTMDEYRIYENNILVNIEYSCSCGFEIKDQIDPYMLIFL